MKKIFINKTKRYVRWCKICNKKIIINSTFSPHQRMCDDCKSERHIKYLKKRYPNRYKEPLIKTNKIKKCFLKYKVMTKEECKKMTNGKCLLKDECEVWK